VFDKRGCGLSDRVQETRLPTLEQRMDEVRAVSSAVRDLVAGSGIRFEDRGRRPPKAVPGDWQLFRAAA